MSSPAITLIQDQDVNSTFSGGNNPNGYVYGTSVACPCGPNAYYPDNIDPVDGNSLVLSCWFSTSGGQGLNGITDTEGNEYSIAVQESGYVSNFSSSVTHLIAYSTNIKGGSNFVITANFTAACACYMNCTLVNGMAATNPLDQTGFSYPTFGNEDEANGPAVTPTYSGEAVFCTIQYAGDIVSDVYANIGEYLLTGPSEGYSGNGQLWASGIAIYQIYTPSGVPQPPPAGQLFTPTWGTVIGTAQCLMLTASFSPVPVVQPQSACIVGQQPIGNPYIGF